MFAGASFYQTVQIPVSLVGRNVREVIQRYAAFDLEGRCISHGLVRPDSLILLSTDDGRPSPPGSAKFVAYECEFYAEICNPVPGSVHVCFVRESNEFGVLAEAGTRNQDNVLLPAMEVVIAKESSLNTGSVDVSALKPGQEISVEILEASYDVHDTRIMAVGRAVDRGAAQETPDPPDAPDRQGASLEPGDGRDDEDPEGGVMPGVEFDGEDSGNNEGQAYDDDEDNQEPGSDTDDEDEDEDQEEDEDDESLPDS
jgi:DNA-directed RNA polymerase subunit E'/Rpb7